MVLSEWFSYCYTVPGTLNDTEFQLHYFLTVSLSLSLYLFVSPFLYPSYLAPPFFFIFYNSAHYSCMFRSPIFQHSCSPFCTFSCSCYSWLPIHSWLHSSTRLYGCPLILTIFLDTFLHYISPVFLGTSHWLIDVRSSRHFISHVTSILIAKLNANTCGRPSPFCACLCVCVGGGGSVNNGSRITADDTVTPPIFHRWQSDVGWMTF